MDEKPRKPDDPVSEIDGPRERSPLSQITAVRALEKLKHLDPELAQVLEPHVERRKTPR